MSRVSVSLITFSPEESLVYFQVGCFSKGFPFTLRSTSSGSNTGKSFFLTLLKDKENQENRFRRINVRKVIPLEDLTKSDYNNVHIE